MMSIWQDLRYGIRLIRNQSGFTAVVALSMALAISANTTVFSWIQTVLLHPLPGVEREAQFVAIETVTPSGEYIDSSYPDYRDYRDQAKLFDGLIVFQDRPLSMGDDRQTERVWAELVSGNFFDVLGVKPAVGRFFLPQEQAEKPGAFPVAVIGHGLWQRRFNADPGIVGKTIKLNRQTFTVIGIAPADFKGTIVGLTYDVWVPLMMQAQLTGVGNWLESRSSRPLKIMGRLKPGVTSEAARAEIQTIARQLAQSYPRTNQVLSATVLPIWSAPYGAQSVLSKLLLILMGVGFVVLLIVCANVANLLLARASARRKEISIRLAVGANRGRLIRQLVTESLLLSLLGSFFGVVLAFWMTDFLRLFIPSTDLPVLLNSQINGQALGFTLALSVFAGLLFGLAPAFQVTNLDLYESLKEGGRSATAGTRSRRLRGSLVVAEVALAMVALVGAGLFVKSFENAKRINPGFDAENVLLVGMDLSSSGYDRDRGKAFYRQLRGRLEALPGVKSVSYAEDVPLGFDGGSWEDTQIEGYTPRPNEDMKLYRNLVAPGYFELMRIQLLQGRDFAESDDEHAPSAVIVNETFIRRFLPGQNPIGRQIRGWGRPLTIVGVVKDIKYRTLGESPQPYMYVPFQQFYHADTGTAIHLRTTGAPESMLPAVRNEIRALDASVSIFVATPLHEYIGASVFAQKIAATLLSLLGVLALVLAVVGIYSVMSYAVAQRTQEFGIRMALGAQAGDVLKLVIKQGMVLALTGVAIGLVASLALARLLGTMLLDVRPTDPLTFTVIPVLLTTAALLACYIPARRATKIYPTTALRTD